ncbi:MAG: class D sortase [Lachnospiraceae bacterium]|nr:class D sortase [Lachnospiraceae bacterium]
MKKQSKFKRIIEYIYIPLLLAACGFGIIYLTLKPVLEMVSSVSGMVITQSVPEFKTTLGNIYDENSNPATEGTLSAEDIEFPTYETCYGWVSCDKLGVNAPIFWGDSERVFREGVGQYIGSFLPGYDGVILLGAHDSMYFESLEFVEIGDEFVVKTNYGIYTYKVTKTKVGDDKDSQVYDELSGKEELVMYTCYPFGALIGVKDQRFYVFSEKVTGPEVVKE